MPKNNQPIVRDYLIDGDVFSRAGGVKPDLQASIITFVNSLPRNQRAMIKILMHDHAVKVFEQRGHPVSPSIG